MITNTATSASPFPINEAGYADFLALTESPLNMCGVDGTRGDGYEWLESPEVDSLIKLIEARGEHAITATPGEDEGESTLWIHPAIAFAFTLQGNPAFLLQLSDHLTGAKPMKA